MEISEPQKLIINQIMGLPDRFKPRADRESIWIRCPFHKGAGSDGLERTQSLRIRTVRGKFPLGSAFCHGCGKSFASWNDLAPELELARTLDYAEEPYDVLTAEEAAVMLGKQESTGLNMKQMNKWPSKIKWRTISGKAIRAVGGRLYYSYSTRQDQLYLPCIVMGNHVGGIRCLIEPGPNDKRKYFNTEGSWSRSSALYPFDYTNKMLDQSRLSTLVLVEGPRDALNLIQHDIPAMATLGSTSWGPRKVALVQGLDLNLIILATDPDEPGDKMAKAIKADLKSSVKVIRFKLNADIGEDPGNMKINRINRLKEYLV